ncbi:MAG: PAS domain S-box protein [Phycisphaerae bacterium]|nr:PAS domain S-box protein [Phycisphaerae bacterium]
MSDKHGRDGGPAPEPKADVAALRRRVAELEEALARCMETARQAQMLSIAAEQTREGLAVVDLDGNILFVNEAFAAMHGYHVADVVGKHLSVFHSQEQLPAVEEALQVLRADGHCDGQVWHVRRDGVPFLTQMHNALLRDPSGTPIGIIGTARDITEEKRETDALRQGREAEVHLRQRMQALFDVRNELATLESVDALCRRAVELMRSRLGFDRVGIWFRTEEPRTMRGSFGTDEHGGLRDERERVLPIGDSMQALLDRQSPGMVVREDDVSLFDDAGSVVGRGMQVWTGIWDDRAIIGFVTADNLLTQEAITYHDEALLALCASSLGHLCTRLRTGAALRESQRTLSTLMSNLPGMAYRCRNDEQWTMEFVSEGCRDLTGYDPDDLVDNRRVTYAQLIHPDDRQMVWEGVQAGVAKRASFRLTYRIITASSEERWVSEQGRGVFSATGELEALEGFMADITERKRADEALRESEARFRTVTEGALTGVYIVQDDLFRYVNPALAHTFQRSPDELVDRIGPLELTHPDDQPWVAEQYRRRREGEVESSRYTFRGVRKDGTIIHCEVLGREVEYQGRPAIIGTLLDVSERKRAQEELARTQALLLAAINQTPAGIVIADAPDVRIRLVNRAALEIRGQVAGAQDVPPELHAEQWQTFRPDGVPVKLAETPLSLAIHGGTTSRNVEALVRRYDGELRWVLANAAPVRDARGETIAGVVVFSDITDRVQAQAALRESEERHRTVLDQMQEAVVFANEHDVIRHINGFACELLGVARDDVIGHTVTSVHSGPVRLKVDEIIHRFREESHIGAVTSRRTLGDRELIFRFSPVRRADGTYGGIIANIIDVTEQVRMQQRLFESRRIEAIGTLAGGVAHDFNNLMTTVLGNASRLKGRRRPDHPDYPSLVEIENAAETAGKLAHQLLAFARGGKILPRVIGFAEVVEHALTIARPAIPANIEMDLCVPDDLWKVDCDATQVEQVIVNFCRNAVDAMPRGGRLVVRAENRVLRKPFEQAQPPLAPGEYACVTVTDSGSGMDAETAARVFEPFFTTKPDGYGLGLAAAWGIMKSHGGAVALTSEMGRGSSFTAWLPRAQV